MKYIQSLSSGKARHRIFVTLMRLLLCVGIAGPAYAGPITQYRMDNLLNLPGFGSFFTFSVDDLNGDGIGSHDEIRDFSGLACLAANCPFPEWTTLGKVDRDFTFGGSGEAFFDLTTLNWTYNIIGGTKVYAGPTPTIVPPYNATLGADFGLSSEFNFGPPGIALLGTPIRLFVPNGGPQIWGVTAVPEPGTLGMVFLGLCGVALSQRKRRSQTAEI